MSSRARQAPDPLEREIEAALDPGRFVSDRACFTGRLLRPWGYEQPGCSVPVQDSELATALLWLERAGEASHIDAIDNLRHLLGGAWTTNWLPNNPRLDS